MTSNPRGMVTQAEFAQFTGDVGQAFAAFHLRLVNLESNVDSIIGLLIDRGIIDTDDKVFISSEAMTMMDAAMKGHTDGRAGGGRGPGDDRDNSGRQEEEAKEES